MDAANWVSCPNCGQMLPADALVCPRCQGFVHRHRLQQLSAEAQRIEAVYPEQAAHYWRQALELLPPGSPQYGSILQRLEVLGQVHGRRPARHAGPAGPVAQTTDYYAPEPPGEQALYPQAPPTDTPATAFIKTVGSMALSLGVYTVFFRAALPVSFAYSFQFALGFVVLMLVHEMGHVFAIWHYGLSASPPIFVPFMGALINLRQQPQNAWVEAVVGIGGPMLGTAGAIAAYALAAIFPQHSVLLHIAFFGFWLNLFNMLPIPPLDGGRITAAVSPRIWMVGVAILAGMVAIQYFLQGFLNWILLLILFIAWPRIKQTLRSRNPNDPYYRIPVHASYTMAALYLGLGFVLVAFYLMIRTKLPPMMF